MRRMRRRRRVTRRITTHSLTSVWNPMWVCVACVAIHAILLARHVGAVLAEARGIS